MNSITDDEFGEITLRSSALARSLRARLQPNGRLSISHPPRTPQFVIKSFINSVRPELRKLIEASTPQTVYQHGTPIGKSHTLLVRTGNFSKPRLHTDGQQLILEVSDSVNIDSTNIQSLIRAEVVKILRKQAKNYLPRRLKFLADKYGFSYERVRFSHASSRWGSCSSTGTISLNIALMKLPHELIDYVLIHELCHTREMNHSDRFWDEVSQIIPDYKLRRRQIKRETPNI